jgi:hypothetical protein
MQAHYVPRKSGLITFHGVSTGRLLGEGIARHRVARRCCFDDLRQTSKLEGGMEKALQYDRLAAPLVKAVQQLEAENDDLRHAVEELRREIRAH